MEKKGYYPYLESQLWGIAAAAYSPARYNAFAIEGYMSNPIVYRCINLIATSVAGIPWKLYRKDAEGNAIHIEKHPIITLLEQPNPITGQADFFTNIVSYLQMSGNTYVKAVGPNNGTPRELYTLRPDRFIITDCNSACYDDINYGYEYTCGASTEWLSPKIVWHGKLWNPLCDFYGLSPLQAAWKNIAQLNASLNWNVALLQNSAMPSGVLTAEGNISDEQVFRLREQMAQRNQGPTNAGRPIVTDGGLSWEQTALSPTDMDWAAGQKISTKDICVALGVDPVLLGDADNRTYATFRDAERSFYTSTVLPNLDRLRDDFLNKWLLPKFPGTEQMYFEYDRDAIEVLGEDQTIVWDRSMRALKEGLITLNEARDSIGYTELGDSPDPEEDEKYTKAFGHITERDKQEYGQRMERTRLKWKNKWQPYIFDRLEEEEAHIIKAIQRSTLDHVKERAEDAIRTSNWDWLYSKLYRSVMEDFGKKTLSAYKSHKADWPDLTWLEDEDELIDGVKERISEITNTSRERVRNAIIAAILLGGTMDDIIQSIRNLYHHDKPIRSKAIAETETITAGNAGAYLAAVSLGIPIQKEWVTMQDDRVRASHAAIHGQKRPLEEKYSNGLRFPGDLLGDAAETINCRCVQVFSTM